MFFLIYLHPYKANPTTHTMSNYCKINIFVEIKLTTIFAHISKIIIRVYTIPSPRMYRKKDVAKKYFNCTPSERAAFEAGIKLGTVYHQFVGTPLSLENVDTLEKAIEESIKVQPFVKNAKVKIDRGRIKRRQGFYKYLTLHGDMLEIELEVQYEDKIAVCRLEYMKDIDYPLMYIKEMREEGD